MPTVNEATRAGRQASVPAGRIVALHPARMDVAPPPSLTTRSGAPPGPVARLLRRLRRALQRRRAWAHLSQLDDRLLADIGLSRQGLMGQLLEAEQAAVQPAATAAGPGAAGTGTDAGENGPALRRAA